MTNFKWAILETTTIDGELTAVHYLLTANDSEHEVKSEGHADVAGKINVPYDRIMDTHVFDCLNEIYMQDDANSLKSRLQEQLDYLKQEVSNDLPWKGKVFSVKF
jgi:hypothetical protein